jgi:hypothetical protein
MKQNDVKMTEDEFKKVITSTVKETLTNLGCKTDDPIEMQKDFGHLRKSRESVDAIKKKSWLTAVGFVVLLVLGAIVRFISGE